MKKGFLVSFIIITIAVVACSVFLSVYPPKNSFEEKQPSPSQNLPSNKEAVLYKEKYPSYNFTDPNENAFIILIPDKWKVSNDSGLVRPYIDAGILIKATSENNSGFFLASPYMLCTVPNSLLSFAGFKEGDYYDASNGLAKPMLVKNYTSAKQFLEEYVKNLNVDTEVLDILDRPELIQEDKTGLVTKQSAAEMTYLVKVGENEVMNKLVVYNYLIEISGTGLWVSQIFGYFSFKENFNETEYLVSKSIDSFKVNPQWAIKEAQEVNKRLGIISSTQTSVSDTISSSFDYKSASMDRINNEWSKATLGIEEVSNPETGESWTVESGSNYYWKDNKGNIYGTQTYENPFPQEDLTLLQIN